MSKFTTAEQAQQAFYDAFADGSLENMSAVWSDDSDVVCVHPGSDVLHGKTVIMQSWERIFSPGMSASIEMEPVSVFESDNIAVHIVYEHLGSGSDGQLATVIATNVFRLGAAGWHIVEHHGTQPVVRLQSAIHTLKKSRVLQ